MNEAAERYAKALFMLTQDERPLLELKTLFASSPALAQALDSPCIAVREKHALADRICGENETLRNFLKVLCDHGRTAAFAEICDAFHKMQLARENAADLLLTFAFPPTKEEQDKLAKIVAKKHKKDHVILHLREDASLLGGFTLEIEGTVYDRSIRGMLADMRKSLQQR